MAGPLERFLRPDATASPTGPWAELESPTRPPSTAPAQPTWVPEAPVAGGARRPFGRRQALAVAFALGSMVLVGLNVATALQDGGRPAWSGGSVRVIEAPWLRALVQRLQGPVRIGIQVGHLDASGQPDELASLRVSTGAHAAGIDEVEVNQAVADALAARLARYGFTVDLLPATVPPRYRADVLLSIHADASVDDARRGYKSAHFEPARNPREALLKVTVDRAMLGATGLPDDDANVSGNMLQYYAFNDRRFAHAAAAGTPALLVELGYLTHPDDRRLLSRPDDLAAALERGVLAYLRATGRVE